MRAEPDSGFMLRARLAVGGVVSGVVLAGLTVAAPHAFAAGTGYSPGAPAPGGTATGLPGSVVSVTTIQPSGGKGSATIGTSTVTTTVPSGTFSVPTELVVTDAGSVTVTPSNGGSVIVTFGVGFYQDGTKVAGTFPPVTVTIANDSITPGATVYFVVNGALEAVSHPTTSLGSVSFTITSDPTVELVSGPSTTVPAATTVSTGEPFLLEGGIAALLVVAGVLLLTRALTRRTT